MAAPRNKAQSHPESITIGEYPHHVTRGPSFGFGSLANGSPGASVTSTHPPLIDEANNRIAAITERLAKVHADLSSNFDRLVGSAEMGAESVDQPCAPGTANDLHHRLSYLEMLLSSVEQTVTRVYAL